MSDENKPEPKDSKELNSSELEKVAGGMDFSSVQWEYTKQQTDGSKTTTPPSK
jgi:hypothetical protein